MWFHAALALASFALVAATARAQQIVIDDFTGTQTYAGGITQMVPGTYSDFASPGGTVLGTERNLELVLDATCGTGEMDLGVDSVSYPSGALNFIRATGCSGSVEAWWDGVQGANTFDPATGLGGISLSGGTRTGFLVTVSNTLFGLGAAAQMKITVYSSATSFSEASFATNAAVYPTTVGVPFASFTKPAAAATPANFASVTAIVLGAYSTGTGFYFGNVDSLATNPVELVAFDAE